MLSGDVDLVETLIRKHKVPVDKQSNFKTALHLACASRSKLIVERLLLAKADTSIQDEKGDTCMHIVAGYFDNELWELLLPFAKEAISVKNNEGKTAIDLLPQELARTWKIDEKKRTQLTRVMKPSLSSN